MTDCARSLGEEHPGTLEVMAVLAEFLERVGKLDEAVAVLRERLTIMQRDGKGKISGDLQGEIDALAQALVRMGRTDQARAETRKLLASLRDYAKENSNDALALNNYAWALLICAPADLRDVATASSLAEKAGKLGEGKTSALLDTLALACHRAGENDKAVALQRVSFGTAVTRLRRKDEEGWCDGERPGGRVIKVAVWWFSRHADDRAALAPGENWD